MSALDNEVMEAKLKEFSNALLRFEEALSMPKDTGLFYLDSAAHRFMLCYELTWKNLRRILKMRDLQVNSPVSTFREAYQEGFIQDPQIFKQMIEDRNIVTHEYFQAKAEEVYTRLPGYLKAMREVAEAVERGYQKDEGAF